MYQEQGFVIQVSEYIVSDAIISILTKDGIKSFFGRGYLKQDDEHNKLLNKGLFINFNAKEEYGYYVLETYEIDKDKSLKQLNKETYTTFIDIIKVILLSSYEVDQTTFNLFEYTVKNINTYTNELLKDIWKVYFLKKHNVILNLDCCIKCQSKENLKTLSIKDGGLLCSSCYQEERLISLQTIKIIKSLYQSKINKELNDTHTKEVSLVLSELLFDTVGIKI